MLQVKTFYCNDLSPDNRAKFEKEVNEFLHPMVGARIGKINYQLDAAQGLLAVVEYIEMDEEKSIQLDESTLHVEVPEEDCGVENPEVRCRQPFCKSCRNK